MKRLPSVICALRKEGFLFRWEKFKILNLSGSVILMVRIFRFNRAFLLIGRIVQSGGLASISKAHFLPAKVPAISLTTALIYGALILQARLRLRKMIKRLL